jgi:recombination protein RecA
VASLGTLDKLDALAGTKPALSLGWPKLDALLPDGGLPRGVVEISSRHALGGPTRIGARAIAAAHAKNASGWCAWIDPEGSLHAPGLARVGVDLSRLFVVRPPRADLGRIAVKVARAGAFDVVVVDMDAVRAPDAPWLAPYPGATGASKRERARRPLPTEVIVRKLALAAEEGEATVILLTDAAEARARSVPWPVALRLELERRPDAISVRVAKDHRGRASLARTWVPIAELRA